MPKFGRKSQAVLETIHPYLGMVCDEVVRYNDISLLIGKRSKAEQDRLFAIGASKKQWPDSKHNVKDKNAKFPNDLSWAVDAAPYPIPEGWGDLKSQGKDARDLEWKERVKFYQMVALFKFAFAQLRAAGRIPAEYILRFGADWDGDNDFRDQTFDDLPHIELIKVE